MSTYEVGQMETPRKGRTGLIAGLGCVGIAAIVIIPVILCVGLIGVIGVGVFGALKQSEPYVVALEAAQSDPEVTAALGEPVEAGWWVMGSIETAGLSGQADLQFPISGPDGSGMVNVGARRENGVWNYYTLAASIDDTGQLIDLR